MASDLIFTTGEHEGVAIDLSWRSLYRIGGASALICALMYLVTIGIYIPANLANPPPQTVLDWFTTLEESPITGLFFLGLADMIIMVFWGPMSLALHMVLRKSSKTWVLIATPFVFVGMAVFLASNPALSLLSISREFAAAATPEEENILLAAGQSMLAITRGGGVLYAGMPLVWLSGLILSAVMLRSSALSKATAWVGIIGFGLLVLGVPFGGHYTATSTPTAFQSAMVALQYVGGGILSMVWYILIGLRLIRISFR